MSHGNKLETYKARRLDLASSESQHGADTQHLESTVLDQSKVRRGERFKEPELWQMEMIHKQARPKISINIRGKY